MLVCICFQISTQSAMRQKKWTQVQIKWKLIGREVKWGKGYFIYSQKENKDNFSKSICTFPHYYCTILNYSYSLGNHLPGMSPFRSPHIDTMVIILNIEVIKCIILSRINE